MPTSPRIVDLALGSLTLEAGVTVPDLHARVWWWGPTSEGAALDATLAARPASADPTPSPVDPADRRPVGRPDTSPLVSDVPTVLCVHALTGDARVGGPGGWWDPLVGEGRPLDPRRVRILCVNNLGSCYGTTGPSDPGFPTLADVEGERPDVDKGDFVLPSDLLPAPITTWDQARMLLRVLDTLGVDRLDLLVGGSVGGMIALALAALAPERVPHLIPIATLDRATPWILGWNHVGRQAIVQALEAGVDPGRSLAIARQLAHMTYRASAGLMARHGRSVVGEAWSAHAPYRVQTYLEHQGAKLASRFDARAYLSTLDTMDHHDLGRPPPPPDEVETWTPRASWAGLAEVSARMDAVAIDSDALFFASEIHDMVVRHRLHGHEASWTLLHSPHGHDAFLATWDTLARVLTDALRVVDPGRFP